MQSLNCENNSLSRCR